MRKIMINEMKPQSLTLIFFIIIFFECKEHSAEKPEIADKTIYKTDTVASEIKALLKYYPQVQKFADNKLYFKDGTYILYDDSASNKSFEQMLVSPDVKDQFRYKYVKGKLVNKIEKNNDPGRVTNEAFFKKIYGATREEVRKNLTEVLWCPKLIGQKILVTKINGVDKQISKISDELDKLPEYKEFVKDIGGTFNWRYVSASKRVSMHSFGMSIDINTNFSNYWQWDCKCTDENAVLDYKNRIPQKIVDVFEKYGFIWGGKWYHYDTMHFEYRPELLDE
ncbi:MAG TPA: M15 family metallopeptidase [Puia sp.]|nr:M15 family metallopeptidase [Puia sp.]